jgi:hypothetical protein
MLQIFLVLLACGTGDSVVSPESTTAPVAVSAPASAVSSPAISVSTDATATEALKVADAADGTEDGIAHKCAGCALGMDGNAAHALKVDDTTLHLCSAMCKEYFSKDVASNLTSLVN